MSERRLRALRKITPVEAKSEKEVIFVAPRATKSAIKSNILQL